VLDPVHEEDLSGTMLQGPLASSAGLALSDCHVILDATAGARDELSGVGRYVHELVRALGRQIDAPQLELGVRFSKWSRRKRLPAPDGSSRVLRVVDDRLDFLLLRDCDLFHGLDARITPWKKIPRTATLHDVFSLERDDLARDQFRAKKADQYRRLADEADAIACVSSVTESAFLSLFPQARDRTHVVHHGVGPEFRPADGDELAALRAKHGLEHPFLLFVGLLSTRKNLLVLLAAFAELARAHEELELVLAGKESHGYDEIEAAIERHPFKARIRRLGYVPSEDLPVLYSAAECFVFPSLTEGFGLPILEAFACGTPAVASDLPVLLEVGGDELEVAAVGDPSAFAAACARVLAGASDEAARTRRIRRAARFTWDEAAAATLDLWRIALDRFHR